MPTRSCFKFIFILACSLGLSVYGERPRLPTEDVPTPAAPVGPSQPQGRTTIKQRSQTNRGGNQINVSENYSAESRRILEDFLKDHPQSPQAPDAVVIGRDNEFKVIIPTSGNTNTTTNVNLFVTVEKGYVRLTREQKRVQTLIAVDRKLIVKSLASDKTVIKVNLEGIKLPDNIFIRVTDDPKQEFMENDDYYFIASKVSNDAEEKEISRIDPMDLVLDPGSDKELAHLGIEAPTSRDYLPRIVVKDPNYPALYPRTRRVVEAANAETAIKNDYRWRRFCDELQARRRQLQLSDKSKALIPELYFRYNPAALAPTEERETTTKLGSDAYLVYEWDIEIPQYEAMQNPVNLPIDYYEAFAKFHRNLSAENASVQQRNTEKWNTFATAVQAKIPNPHYSAYYYRHIYKPTVQNITPGLDEQDDPPRRGTLAELRKYGITKLPKYYPICLLQGIPYPPGPGAIGGLTQFDVNRINEHNRKTMNYNLREWRGFRDALKDNGLRVSNYAGKTISGQFILDLDNKDIVRDGNAFFYYLGPSYALPKIEDED